MYIVYTYMYMYMYFEDPHVMNVPRPSLFFDLSSLVHIM